MSVIVRSFMPGERLNLGPLDRRSISWVLRLRVRSVTRLALFVVSLAEGLVLLVSVLLELFLGSVAVFVWAGELCRLLLPGVLALLWFLRLSRSFRNFLLCRLLAVLHAKYLWERILDATSLIRCEDCCYPFIKLSKIDAPRKLHP